jgi:hypothetical protein
MSRDDRMTVILTSHRCACRYLGTVAVGVYFLYFFSGMWYILELYCMNKQTLKRKKKKEKKCQ